MDDIRLTGFWENTRLLAPLALSLLLIGALLASALGVVYNAQHSRQLFFQLESLRQAQNELDSQWGRLTLERSTLLSHAHVEQVASQSLGMRRPLPENIVVVRP